MGYRRFRRPPSLGERRTALVARFFDNFENFGKFSKNRCLAVLGCIWDSGRCGIFSFLVFWRFWDFLKFWIFLVFWVFVGGGLEILAGGSGVVLGVFSRV